MTTLLILASIWAACGLVAGTRSLIGQICTGQLTLVYAFASFAIACAGPVSLAAYWATNRGHGGYVLWRAAKREEVGA